MSFFSLKYKVEFNWLSTSFPSSDLFPTQDSQKNQRLDTRQSIRHSSNPPRTTSRIHQCCLVWPHMRLTFHWLTRPEGRFCERALPAESWRRWRGSGRQGSRCWRPWRRRSRPGPWQGSWHWWPSRSTCTQTMERERFPSESTGTQTHTTMRSFKIDLLSEHVHVITLTRLGVSLTHRLPRHDTQNLHLHFLCGFLCNVAVHDDNCWIAFRTNKPRS